jgi:hypothetical protein
MRTESSCAVQGGSYKFRFNGAKAALRKDDSVHAQLCQGWIVRDDFRTDLTGERAAADAGHGQPNFEPTSAMTHGWVPWLGRSAARTKS